jgi:hypothetical protein
MNQRVAGEFPSAPRRGRAIYGAVLCAIIVAGLACRWPMLNLPLAFAKYAGAILWGAMVYFVVSVISPTTAVPVRVMLSAIGAAAIEFSQLLHWQWLDAFRQTIMGALLLGRTFSWWDIVAYWVGILCASVIDAKTISPVQTRAQPSPELP